MCEGFWSFNSYRFYRWLHETSIGEGIMAFVSWNITCTCVCDATSNFASIPYISFLSIYLKIIIFREYGTAVYFESSTETWTYQWTWNYLTRKRKNSCKEKKEKSSYTSSEKINVHKNTCPFFNANQNLSPKKKSVFFLTLTKISDFFKEKSSSFWFSLPYEE